ncbi:RecQ family ATP-dependent DNA helicase [Chryseobacterium manosquense]|uniref:ATP-dependent DNA helicase RecQ n=1 Tax=Chryseobacterium manosquense TaxID=2754694 RepID=A0A7H1DTT9_9FLAO|nr:ATP-dependent DNA helicase RecQ [Chryseobacterium manosquense]QNS40397.1 RecQ family ATP-dependent DNA helicase [Chryseobacterium manosquense]
MISQQDFQQLKFQTLKHFWGYDRFRDSQEEIINSVINRKDTLALLPTGGGKSLCYQLPALLLEGTCLVISPLLALMKDQVYQLKNSGIEAEYLSSELDEFDAEVIFNRCKDGLTKILYVSPERLTNRVFLQNLEEIQISFIAVDEAHCISQWGQDFRPSYQNIKAFRQDFNNIPCLALTATATPQVLREIQLKLNLNNPVLFQKSFRRTNIKIISDKISDKYQRVLNLLKYNNSTGIIYVRTRKEAEELTRFLQRNQISNVDFFHAGLPVKEKNQKQTNWINSNNHVLVSTNAFGMGIDKDNVRFVIHFSPPPSIENYYQEIGRAGRDGLESHAFLLWNEQELSDLDSILRNQIPSKKEFYDIVSYLYSSFQVAENDLPETVFQLQVQRIQNFTKASMAKIKNVLNFLHVQEIVFFNNNKSRSSLELKIAPDDIDLLSKKDAYFIELLLRNYSGLSSHKIMFSEMTMSKKIDVDVFLIKQRIKELQQKNFLEYIDGALASIKFLKHRDDRAISGKYWNLFEQIQKNKLKKWEEMKFFLQDSDYCKMKLILSYFGEKNVKNCGQCSVCESQKESVFGRDISREIIEILKQKPSNVEEIAIKLNYYKKENILENLIHLLDSGEVKMLNFRTYAYKNE